MTKDEVLSVYDHEYASSYDRRFHVEGASALASQGEVELIRSLLAGGGDWLDVGCGTGFVLSHFAGHRRAGLDLSPAMLEIARDANPDALFFRQADFLQSAPEWNGTWDLVSCMWFAYCLVESVSDIRGLIRNLANWTSAEGACVVPICDPNLLMPGFSMPAGPSAESYLGGHVEIVGVVWNWTEADRTHRSMISPDVRHMAQLFGEDFAHVEHVKYPLAAGEAGPARTAIVARNPRASV